MNFYIATGFARQREHNKVRDALHAHRRRRNPDNQHLFITYDWTLPEYQIKGKEREIAKDEIDGVVGADLVIVLLPGKYGTHAELGAALALGNKVFLSGPKDAPCIFYDHPLVTYVEEDVEAEPFETPKLLAAVLTWVEALYDKARENEP